MTDRSDESSRPLSEAAVTPSPGRLAGYDWWLFLAAGVALLIFGTSTLVKSPDRTASLAWVAGVTFIVDALLLCLLASQAEEWRGFYLLAALTGIAGVALAAFFEGHTLGLLALVLAVGLILRGLVDSLVAWTAVTDFTEMSKPWWAFFFFGVGIANLLLGALALVTRGGSSFLLLLVVGGCALVRGVGMLALSSRFRVLA